MRNLILISLAVLIGSLCLLGLAFAYSGVISVSSAFDYFQNSTHRSGGNVC